ncbi:MAG: hypothetical protein AABM43_00580 [Actinomycetota bacterium]
MSLGWTADGIAKALDCGGVPLEVYRRPGFTRGRAVRRSAMRGQRCDPATAPCARAMARENVEVARRAYEDFA